jgi:hypothetical protein
LDCKSILRNFVTKKSHADRIDAAMTMMMTAHIDRMIVA